MVVETEPGSHGANSWRGRQDVLVVVSMEGRKLQRRWEVRKRRSFPVSWGKGGESRNAGNGRNTIVSPIKHGGGATVDEKKKDILEAWVWKVLSSRTDMMEPENGTEKRCSKDSFRSLRFAMWDLSLRD